MVDWSVQNMKPDTTLYSMFLDVSVSQKKNKNKNTCKKYIILLDWTCNINCCFFLRYQLQIILRLEIQSMVHGGDQNISILEDKVEEVKFLEIYLCLINYTCCLFRIE